MFHVDLVPQQGGLIQNCDLDMETMMERYLQIEMRLRMVILKISARSLEYFTHVELRVAPA